MRHVWLVALLTVFVWGCGKSDHPNLEVADKEAGSKTTIESLSPEQQFEQLNIAYVQELEQAKNANGSPAVADQYAGKFLELASAHPEDRTAFASLNWVAMLATDPDLQNQAIDRLVAEHLDQEALSRICSQLAQRPLSDASEVQLTAMIEKSPHDVVRATATMALASQLSSIPAEQQDEARIKDLYQSVIDQYSSRPRLVAAANGALAKFRFRIGQVAPEIEGEDLDGEAFKLSDYRGKVVVIDFWGDW